MKACLQCQGEFPGDLKVCPADGTVLTPIGEEDLVGKVFAGNYEIISVLGGGGMGLVYKARHRLMNRTAAIKVLHREFARNLEALKRFQVEAQAASALNSPHILTIYDFGVSPSGQPYMVMDYLEGRGLNEILDEQGHLPLARAIPIFSQIAAALEHAHGKGIVHRDVKPSNIMLLDMDGQHDYVKLVDFGIAKLLNPSNSESENLTRTGEVFGSPLYMSPEQCRGKKLDARTDIYSLGAVMYRTLTGRPLYDTGDAMDTMFKQVSQLPDAFTVVCPQLDIPPAIESVVFKTLAKDPSSRHQSMHELRQDLDEALDRLHGQSAKPDDGRRLGSPASDVDRTRAITTSTEESALAQLPVAKDSVSFVLKKRTIVTAAALGAGLIVGAALLTSFLGGSPQAQRQPTPEAAAPAVVPQQPLPATRDITQYEPIKTPAAEGLPPTAAPLPAEAPPAAESVPPAETPPAQQSINDVRPQPILSDQPPQAEQTSAPPKSPEHKKSKRAAQEDQASSARPSKAKRALGKIKNAFKNLLHKL